ncbi:hypothetical protein M231_05729 [Tremella mesenterica]|uniref:Uncharacterized protein n=1 Tax=Tremella mesenterica TaxID=5217 RepID=A0A4Q1BHF3_TREME|nr:hypothetical protein M231_05729 [Tremella mesenterica]
MLSTVVLGAVPSNASICVAIEADRSMPRGGGTSIKLSSQVGIPPTMQQSVRETFLQALSECLRHPLYVPQRERYQDVISNFIQNDLRALGAEGFYYRAHEMDVLRSVHDCMPQQKWDYKNKFPSPSEDQLIGPPHTGNEICVALIPRFQPIGQGEQIWMPKYRISKGADPTLIRKIVKAVGTFNTCSRLSEGFLMYSLTGMVGEDVSLAHYTQDEFDKLCLQHKSEPDKPWDYQERVPPVLSNMLIDLSLGPPSSDQRIHVAFTLKTKSLDEINRIVYEVEYFVGLPAEVKFVPENFIKTAGVWLSRTYHRMTIDNGAILMKDRIICEIANKIVHNISSVGIATYYDASAFIDLAQQYKSNSKQPWNYADQLSIPADDRIKGPPPIDSSIWVAWRARECSPIGILPYCDYDYYVGVPPNMTNLQVSTLRLLKHVLSRRIQGSCTGTLLSLREEGVERLGRLPGVSAVEYELSEMDRLINSKYRHADKEWDYAQKKPNMAKPSSIPPARPVQSLHTQSRLWDEFLPLLSRTIQDTSSREASGMGISQLLASSRSLGSSLPPSEESSSPNSPWHGVSNAANRSLWATAHRELSNLRLEQTADTPTSLNEMASPTGPGKPGSSAQAGSSHSSSTPVIPSIEDSMIHDSPSGTPPAKVEDTGEE